MGIYELKETYLKAHPLVDRYPEWTPNLHSDSTQSAFQPPMRSGTPRPSECKRFHYTTVGHVPHHLPEVYKYLSLHILCNVAQRKMILHTFGERGRTKFTVECMKSSLPSANSLHDTSCSMSCKVLKQFCDNNIVVMLGQAKLELLRLGQVSLRQVL